MDYSPKDRRKAIKQIHELWATGEPSAFDIAAELQCHLNAAVELLRHSVIWTPMIERGPALDFLADFPVPVETKR